MPLKTRITLWVIAAAISVCTLGAVLLRWHQQGVTARQQDFLLKTQRNAWDRLESELLKSLRADLARILSQPAWTASWQSQNKEALGAQLQPQSDLPRWRADVFDNRRALFYSTSTHWREDPLVETSWVTRALGSNSVVAGLSQVSADRYDLVVALGFGEGATRGVLALGIDISHLLPALATALEGESFLINLRGREVAGTRPGQFTQERLSLPLRQPAVVNLSLVNDRHALAIIQPLYGPERRGIGALLLMKDVTSELEAIRREVTIGGVGALLSILALGWAFSSYLKHVMRPMERSIQVLDALSRGDLHTAPDEKDLELTDEAGQIARGVETLREEMLNLQMLRDERIRTREQQERLIRRQLKTLAESLDSASREEILQALQPDIHNGTTRTDGSDLVELAGILGRLSGLVTTQQKRLRKLLEDLRAAMAQQAALVSLKQELEIARRMQLSILPRAAPQTRAVDVEALMLPAKEIGGDFYDYFMLDEDRLAIVVADVSGKGVPAAFFMAIARTLLKSSALFSDTPGNTIARLNEQLCADNDQMMFVTVFFAELHLNSGEMVFVNAGHNPPVLRKHSGEIGLFPKVQNTAVAIMEDLPYAQGRITLARDDTVLFYTDGVTEATNPNEQLFGEAALMETVRQHRGAAGLPSAVLAAVRVFENGSAQADDITCVSLRYRGTS